MRKIEIKWNEVKSNQDAIIHSTDHDIVCNMIDYHVFVVCLRRNHNRNSREHLSILLLYKTIQCNSCKWFVSLHWIWSWQQQQQQQKMLLFVVSSDQCLVIVAPRVYHFGFNLNWIKQKWFEELSICAKIQFELHLFQVKFDSIKMEHHKIIHRLLIPYQFFPLFHRFYVRMLWSVWEVKILIPTV